jgi:hypothetical protein
VEGDVVIAYKFLAAGAIGPLSRVAWPAAGTWLDTGDVIVGRRGAHLCRADQLAHWLHDELWAVETDGPGTAAPDCFVVARARLVTRIAGWNADGAARFVRACIDHAREASPAAAAAAAEAEGADAALLADARDALAYGYPAIAAYNAALAVARDDEARYAAERAWQSAWLANDLL